MTLPPRRPLDTKTRSAAISALRSLWRRHPVRLLALKKAELREYLPLNKDGSKPARPRVYRICAMCGCRCKDMPTTDYPKAEVDHIEAVVPITGEPLTLDEFAERLLMVGVDEIQVLCRPCHRLKSNTENAIRRESKQNERVQKCS